MNIRPPYRGFSFLYRLVQAASGNSFWGIPNFLCRIVVYMSYFDYFDYLIIDVIISELFKYYFRTIKIIFFTIPVKLLMKHL